MARYGIYFYGAASILIIASVLYGLIVLVPYLYHVERHAIVFDSVLASECSACIADDIKKMNGLSPAAMFTQLQKKYVFLKSMCANYTVDGSLNMEFVSFKPLLNVRNEQVKLDNGYYVAASVFTQESLAKVSRYTICANDRPGSLASPDLISCVDKIPDSIALQYNILFTDAHEINLQDHEKTGFLIRSSLAKLENFNLYAQCEKIKKSFLQDGMVASSDKVFWVADVRFDNQIVLYQQKEELWYGS